VPHDTSYLLGLVDASLGWSPPSVTNEALVGLVRLRDLLHGGTGSISGTVKVDGSPDQPVSKRTQLIAEHDGQVIREQWSDPHTGAYLFENVDQKAVYTVVAFDDDGVFQAVIADNLTPEAM
jgi:hypothetical protein